MSLLAWIGWGVVGLLACTGLVVGNVWWMARHLDDQGEEQREDRDGD